MHTKHMNKISEQDNKALRSALTAALKHGPSTRLVETRARQHGPCWRVMETGHPSTRAVNSGRQLG